MGVVVQPYARFDLAGLLFTSHPTVRVPGWMFLEYLDEPPERLVAGAVLPHACRVAPRDLATVWERRVGGRPVLSNAALRELVTGAGRLRSLLGTDVDIEWGVDTAGVWFLQGRPATAQASDQ